MTSIAYLLKGRPNLYLNITNRCSNDCYFCIRKFKDKLGEFYLKFDEGKEPSYPEIVQALQGMINRKNWPEVVISGYGEPMERLDVVLDVTRWIKRYYGNVVRIITNGHGYLLNPGREVVKELKQAAVDRVSVSLNAYNKELYNKICRPEFENAFESVLKFIKDAEMESLDTEVTAVMIDDPEFKVSEMRKFAEKIGVKFRERMEERLFF